MGNLRKRYSMSAVVDKDKQTNCFPIISSKDKHGFTPMKRYFTLVKGRETGCVKQIC